MTRERAWPFDITEAEAIPTVVWNAGKYTFNDGQPEYKAYRDLFLRETEPCRWYIR